MRPVAGGNRARAREAVNGRSREVRLGPAGHLVTEERWAELNATLLEFLAGSGETDLHAPRPVGEFGRRRARSTTIRRREKAARQILVDLTSGRGTS